MRRRIALGLMLALAACGRGAPVQRIALDEAGSGGDFVLAKSPDTSRASWRVNKDGRTLNFANATGEPFLSLHCAIAEPGKAPRLKLVRHAQSEPGAKALFAVIGNGTISRFKLNAAITPAGWRWEGKFPADDPQFDVFTGGREIEATVPGGGTLQIAGSELPGEFVDWCRRNGAKAPAAEEKAEKAGAG